MPCFSVAFCLVFAFPALGSAAGIHEVQGGLSRVMRRESKEVSAEVKPDASFRFDERANEGREVKEVTLHEKPSAKKEVKPVTLHEKPSAKQEVKAATSQEKPGAKQEEKPSAKHEEKPSAKHEEKPNAKHEEKLGGKHEGKLNASQQEKGQLNASHEEKGQLNTSHSESHAPNKTHEAKLNTSHQKKAKLNHSHHEGEHLNRTQKAKLNRSHNEGGPHNRTHKGKRNAADLPKDGLSGKHEGKRNASDLPKDGLSEKHEVKLHSSHDEKDALNETHEVKLNTSDLENVTPSKKHEAFSLYQKDEKPIKKHDVKLDKSNPDEKKSREKHEVKLDKSNPDEKKSTEKHEVKLDNSNPDEQKSREKHEAIQSVHWVFVTDCTAYQFNQGNMLLASAAYVNQPGNFSWLTYGCDRDEQRAAFDKKMAHPRAHAWHQKAAPLKDPVTGESSFAFQASNRPTTLFSWFQSVRPQEEAIAIIDPDMFFMRAVHLVKGLGKHDRKSKSGPWEVPAAEPGHGVGAKYGIGCVLNRFNRSSLKSICGTKHEDRCVEATRDVDQCAQSYSSGPPWVIHRSDAENVLSSWRGTAIRVHNIWPDMLAEQGALGVSQAQFGIDNSLDTFWMLSNVEDPAQPWDNVTQLDWDPCRQRSPPNHELAGPPLWHACSTYRMPGFILHKDHIHKDLLDCNAPLLLFPPQNSLEKLSGGAKRKEFLDTWAVCTYTNLVNAHATAWKRKFCKKPNLKPTFMYPPRAETFLDRTSWLTIFRRGGWTDIDYKVVGLGKP